MNYYAATRPRYPRRAYCAASSMHVQAHARPDVHMRAHAAATKHTHNKWVNEIKHQRKTKTHNDRTTTIQNMQRRRNSFDASRRVCAARSRAMRGCSAWRCGVLCCAAPHTSLSWESELRYLGQFAVLLFGCLFRLSMPMFRILRLLLLLLLPLLTITIDINTIFQDLKGRGAHARAARHAAHGASRRMGVRGDQNTNNKMNIKRNSRNSNYSQDNKETE